MTNRGDDVVILSKRPPVMAAQKAQKQPRPSRCDSLEAPPGDGSAKSTEATASFARPPDRKVATGGTFEHLRTIYNPGHVPIHERLIETGGSLKHAIHISDI